MRIDAALLLLFAASLSASAEETATPRMLKVTPVGAQTCVATSFRPAQGQALSGLSWYHNDAQVAFPLVVLLEGQPDLPPDLGEAALILAEVTGASLAWGSLTLETPVVSSTGVIDVVFLYPDSHEITALGEGGGPGIGIWEQAADSPPYLSPDGGEWVAFESGHRLAVEAVYTQSKAKPVVLASLKGSVPEGLFGKAAEEPELRRTLLHAVQPNPFNPRAQIRFELAQAGPAQVRIYDVRGRLVVTLLSEKLLAGPHERVWEGKDQRGHSVASGSYLLVLTTAGRSLHQKLVLLR
jgi:hypothetical protein